jgi:hypothetical protein
MSELVKKIIVVEVGFEYNDNTYDPEEFKFSNLEMYDTIEEAEEAKKRKTAEIIFNFDPLSYYMTDDIRSEIMNFIVENGGEESWDFDPSDIFSDLEDVTPETILKHSKYDEFYNIVRNSFFILEEIETTSNSELIQFKTEMDEIEYDVQIRKSGEGYKAHNTKGPAIKTHNKKWNESNQQFYVDGVSYWNEEKYKEAVLEFNSKRRVEIITDIVEEKENKDKG